MWYRLYFQDEKVARAAWEDKRDRGYKVVFLICPSKWGIAWYVKGE